MVGPKYDPPLAGSISACLSSGWSLIGATIRGGNHVLEGIPCQDVHAYQFEGDTLFLAVADGVSSASKAHLGANLAVQTALQEGVALFKAARPVTEKGWIDLLHSSFESSRARLTEEASSLNTPLSDYATTLILAILHPEGLAAGHIGDGAVVCLDAEGEFRTICPPQNGEFANETFSLTLPDALDRMVCTIHPAPVQALALFSDGVQRFSIHQNDFSPHVPFFAPLFTQLEGVKEIENAAQSLSMFLSSEKVQSLSGDDKTLVLAGKRRKDG